MRFLLAIIDALVGFVQRNPVTVLIIVILAIAAPAVLKGIAMVVLYIILGFAVLFILMMLTLRWRVYRIRRDMEERFGEGFDPDDPNAGFGGQCTGDGRPGREGDVKVRKTTAAPEKRVSKDVGDYVDFEETKEEE